jgi:benzoyl-CoA reductase/2-hydroxyglutaryl-CoA dehydratase subunit BcrC/BadD/HgdB
VSDTSFPAFDEINSLVENYRQVITQSGRPAVGWFCAYTPVELLRAAGLFPYRILPGPGRSMTKADSYIDRNFCPYVRTCLGEALEGKHGDLKGLIVVNSCDAMRRLYDVWRHNIGGDFVYMLDLPRINNEASIAYYRESLQRLAGEIESHFHVRIDDLSIAAAIIQSNRVRALLRELYYANRDSGLPLTAAQAGTAVRAGTLLPPETLAPLLERLVDEVKASRTEANRGKPRIFITGSILENPQVLDLIEECGAVVVADDLCTGTRAVWQPVETGSDPLEGIARHYLGRTPCPRMKDARNRFDHVRRLIDDFRVDGVIFYTLKFCDPFLFDVPVLKEILAIRKIPALSLESDFTPGTMGRVRTRVEAFIEMLRFRTRNPA